MTVSNNSTLTEDYIFHKEMTAALSLSGSAILVANVALFIFYRFYYVRASLTTALTPLVQRHMKLTPFYGLLSLPFFGGAVFLSQKTSSKYQALQDKVIDEFDTLYKNQTQNEKKEDTLKNSIQSVLGNSIKDKMRLRSFLNSLSERKNLKEAQWKNLCLSVKKELTES